MSSFAINACRHRLRRLDTINYFINHVILTNQSFREFIKFNNCHLIKIYYLSTRVEKFE